MLASSPPTPCYERGTGMWGSLDQVSSAVPGERLLSHSPKPTRRISWGKTGSNLETGRHEDWHLIPQLACAELSAF